jgi:hypothetical protein
MTRKRQENVKSSVKNGKSLSSRPQRYHGKPMKWEGLTGISFRICIQEWSANWYEVRGMAFDGSARSIWKHVGNSV